MQALVQRQFGCHRGKLCKVRHQIRADAGKVAAGFVRVALYHTHGQIALPHNAVAGAGDLCGQHLVEFVAVFVQTVILVGQQDAALELSLVDAAVVNCDFCRCAGVESIQQFRIVEKHGCFVLFAGDGVVDIGNDHVLEYWLPTWKIPSAKMRRMGMASCTLRGIRNFSRSIFCAFDRVLIKRFPRCHGCFSS